MARPSAVETKMHVSAVIFSLTTTARKHTIPLSRTSSNTSSKPKVRKANQQEIAVDSKGGDAHFLVRLNVAFL